jgi:hypothetical protein
VRFDSLGYDLEPSILIGVGDERRVGGEISHDIDLIITDQNLRRLPERLTEYSENHLHSGGSARQRRWRPRRRVLPPSSSSGPSCSSTSVRSPATSTRPQGRRLARPLDAHIATKIAALLDRARDGEAGRTPASSSP